MGKGIIIKKYKTSGLQWLELSIISFNGSGYADRNSGEEFIQSYIDYKNWKNKPDQARLAEQYYHAILPLAENLLEAIYPTSHKANEKNYHKFDLYRKQTSIDKSNC